MEYSYSGANKDSSWRKLGPCYQRGSRLRVLIRSGRLVLLDLNVKLVFPPRLIIVGVWNTVLDAEVDADGPPRFTAGGLLIMWRWGTEDWEDEGHD